MPDLHPIFACTINRRTGQEKAAAQAIAEFMNERRENPRSGLAIQF
jgi:hypothetical protein